MRLPALPPLRRPAARTVVGFVGVVALLIVGWLWLRDSSLVAVRQVSVTGVSGPEAARVRTALQDAAHDMTTLHVRKDQLTTAVEPFPAVQAVEASADFPHRLDIVVHEHVAVGAVAAGSDRVAVAADGTLLRDTPSGGLALIRAAAAPAGDRVTDARVRRAVAVLAAAPPALRDEVARIFVGAHGYTLPLRNGPVLYFGTGERLAAKWTAAAGVLADRSSAGATYLDVRLPERPAAGGLETVQLEPSASPTDPGSQPAAPQPSPSGP
jgi:cell division protein FtsQ